MPPPHRRPVSPLALETCAPLDSDPDDYWLPGSDDELDKGELSAQRRRIERLGEAYLKGTPLFILSASLRGPLDKGWINPWKKDRRSGNHPTEQRVIPETNSLKRRHHQSPPAVPRSKSSATPRAASHADSPRKEVTRADTKDRPLRSERPAAGYQSPRFTRPKPTDTRWLKKDKVSTRFQNIEPPTSPTTSISSRHQKRGAITESQSTSRPVTAGYVSPRSSEHQVSSPRHEPERRAALPDGHTPGSNLRKSSSQSVNGDGSIHVVSSSSQLPKFEYRLKQRHKLNANAESQLSPERAEDKPGEAGSKNLPQKPSSTRSSDPAESIIAQNTENSLTLTSASNIIEDPSTTNVDHAQQASQTKTGATSENNLPSAQPLPGNPPTYDNLTSLYSIAISKATSNRTEDHNTDQHFSTQAALMMAQRSFQNDLRSPEDSPMASTRKRRASQPSDYQSPNAINITPFHKVNAPDRDIVDRSDALESGGAPMISTQYMIDAATPFTFSTEKKAGFRTLSSGKDKSKTKKRKTTSFALESPSEIPSDHYTSDEDADNAVRDHPTAAPDSPSGSQRSAFPMTLTGTTPPTAQEGQGAESFDLSQAIAEAGSWLQQSFEINKDITHCRTAVLPQPHSADPTH
ncbi:uncharacterized protein DSM5745_05897 [Aspergillus mulundensis]|uniref:Uncharacterized protein n=1 Tax=Aspergillus mulundensis TaxID=1810919 RepID=A0A3D8RYD5_9EURO|nr:Uncharacterized protein DSM5745_05897 [Aspergillus mulundensis]RDW79045.1 Uncharacterized protein DSM5745_05897 [Aspergillus mulundensis]